MTNRPDGRQANDLRDVTFETGYTKHAPGSVLVSFGDTRVLVTACIEERVPRHIYLSDNDNEGWLTAEYSLLPGSTNTRAQRERQKVSGRTAEIQRLIGRSLRACIDLTKLGQRTITIDADVIQADGGTRVASITGGYVALGLAIEHLITKSKLTESPLLSPVAAVSVGILGGSDDVVLDLNYAEDSIAGVDANVVMNGDGKLIEFQATSEGIPYSREQLITMVDVATDGINELITKQKATLAQASPAVV